ncbi:hypothetical protein DMN91_007853 [Ooceraea biroi]|uniref:Uncharacterized protein n=1 Tax=Ooceraea biroi TaxID=2015173 RepID=A0A3L8DG64_OOCBI|nr:hypothetical protein DMN91_007853 [Ooceraea biroi]
MTLLEPDRVQRGSDELLSQSGAVSNGASMSPQPHHAADNNNDAKKQISVERLSPSGRDIVSIEDESSPETGFSIVAGHLGFFTQPSDR